MRFALALPLLPALAWLAATPLLCFKQEALLFHSVPLPPGTRLAHGADVHEGFVDVADARLSVLELRLPEPRGVVSDCRRCSPAPGIAGSGHNDLQQLPDYQQAMATALGSLRQP
jgi:hypothetical protein